ncbi:MAG: hypothetical protein ACK6D3_01685 [Planctomycetaceae bacterium]
MPPDPPEAGPLSKDGAGSPVGSAADERLRSYLTAVLTASSGERCLNLRRGWHAHRSLQTTGTPRPSPAGDTILPWTAVAASRARRADWDQLEFVWSSCDEADTTKLLGFLNRLTLSDAPEIQSLAARGKMIVEARDELLGHCPDAWSPRLRSLLLQALIRPWNQGQTVRTQLREIPPEDWGRAATVKQFFQGLPGLLPGFEPRYIERLAQWCQRCAARAAGQQSLASALGHTPAADSGGQSRAETGSRPQPTQHSGAQSGVVIALVLAVMSVARWFVSFNSSPASSSLVGTTIQSRPQGASGSGAISGGPSGPLAADPPAGILPGQLVETAGERDIRHARETLDFLESALTADSATAQANSPMTQALLRRLQNLDESISRAQQQYAANPDLFEQFRELRQKCVRLQQRVAP